jgi:hypothetical protein
LSSDVGHDCGDVETPLARIARGELGIDRRQFGEQIGLFEQHQGFLDRKKPRILLELEEA